MCVAVVVIFVHIYRCMLLIDVSVLKPQEVGSNDVPVPKKSIIDVSY